MQALRGEPNTIYGDGTQKRSFAFVADSVEGILRLMSTDDGIVATINFDNPNEISVKRACGMIISITGSRSSLVFNSRPTDDPGQRQPDISQARAKLDWPPKVERRSGLTQTIDYCKAIAYRKDHVVSADSRLQ